MRETEIRVRERRQIDPEVPSEIKGEERKMRGEGREVSCPPEGLTPITRHTRKSQQIPHKPKQYKGGGGNISEMRVRYL